jgi:1,4-dihydroxy-2-naphthoate polyprenyltransferase
MATAGQWIEGARVRTLPAAVSPVLVGAGAAAEVDAFSPFRTVLCLVVSLALQVGVNYANDYSDGIRGTDSERVGPLRLVGSGTASPTAVLRAALVAFGVAAVAGLVLVMLTEAWWLLAVGGAAIAAAWFYTGGRHPYGYRGFGEVMVFVFFGLIAVVGTAYVQAERLLGSAVVAGIGVGALACAILVANNLRDIPTDTAVGKRTLAVRLGDTKTRRSYVALIALSYAVAVVLAVGGRPWCVLAVLSAPLAVAASRPVIRGARGRHLVPVLRTTGLSELTYSVFLALGFALSG